MSIRVTFPYPPTVNTYWRRVLDARGRPRTLLSRRGRKFRQAAEVADIKQYFPISEFHLPHSSEELPITGPTAVHIVLERPDRRRRDLDNVLKPILDGLVHRGVLEDDSQIVQLGISWDGLDPVGNGARAVVFVEPVGGYERSFPTIGDRCRS